MNEVDDRLAGDPVWELFAAPTTGAARESRRLHRYGRWLVVAGLIALSWLLSPPLAVVLACLSIAAGDLRRGRQLSRSIPSKAGGTICARFTYAWGAWKFGMTAVALMFASVFVYLPVLSAARDHPEPPSAFFAALLLAMGGFATSAALTAMGLLAAYRSGMRVWIGEGVNQARTLLLAMLIVGFTLLVLGPMCLLLVGQAPRATDRTSDGISGLIRFVGILLSLLFVGPFVILLVLDWFGRRVIADRPGKFGPKVPTVGKWNSS
jgi:hypothetical protein